MTTRYEREKQFHNDSFQKDRKDREKAVGRFYSVSSSFVRYKDKLTQGVRGLRVLEYGCGPGSSAFLLAERGARVTGIDISDVAIEQARDRAVREQLGGLDFQVMNAEFLDFPDDSFDLICGSAILHHLDLERAYAELARTLRPDGRAIFVEPLGHNPAINLYRWMTPKLRTPDEHPILMCDLRLASRYFGRVEPEFYQLATFLAVPFRRFRFFRAMRMRLDDLDRFLFSQLVFLRRFAWQVVIELSNPRKELPERREVETPSRGGDLEQ